MARKGKKNIVISDISPDEIDTISSYLKIKHKGLHYDIKYSHDAGLVLTLYGPSDLIKLVEHNIFELLSLQDEQE